MAGFTDEKTEFQRSAFGTASASYFLGIGGNDRDALVAEAKEKMRKNFPLASDEVMVNYTLDFKRSFYFIYFEQKVTLRADIVKIIEAIPSPEGGQAPVLETKVTSKPIKLKQDVFVRYKGDVSKATIISAYDNEIEVAIKDEQQKQATHRLPLSKVYFANNSMNEKYNLGDKVSLRNTIIKDADFGTVIGISEKQLLIDVKGEWYEILAE